MRREKTKPESSLPQKIFGDPQVLDGGLGVGEDPVLAVGDGILRAGLRDGAQELVHFLGGEAQFHGLVPKHFPSGDVDPLPHLDLLLLFENLDEIRKCTFLVLQFELWKHISKKST